MQSALSSVHVLRYHHHLVVEQQKQQQPWTKKRQLSVSIRSGINNSKNKEIPFGAKRESLPLWSKDYCCCGEQDDDDDDEDGNEEKAENE